MLLRRFYDDKLAQASYMIGCQATGEAFILDPNREAQPNFTAYNLITNDGRVLNGIIVAESSASITLRRAEGKEERDEG